MSLGRASVHELTSKLNAAATHGLDGVEIFYEDLQFLARDRPGGSTAERELEAAFLIRELCAERRLQVISLQPFWRDEGVLGQEARVAKLEELRHKIRIAHALGTGLILVPSSINVPGDQLSADPEIMASDLREVADIGACQDPPVSFAHESLCWGTRSSTWEQSWDLICRVDRPNFGICLDTFNIAGLVFADPAHPSGRVVDAGLKMKASLEALVHRVDVKKVFLVQIVDAERLAQPLTPDHPFHVSGQPPRMSWSRNCRLFYGEEDRGAYLPVRQVAEVIFNILRYRGWVSMEFFNRSMFDPGPDVPAQHARRAFESWMKLARDCNLDSAVFRVPYVAQKTSPKSSPASFPLLKQNIAEAIGGTKFEEFAFAKDPIGMNVRTERLEAWEVLLWMSLGATAVIGILGSARLLVLIWTC